MGKTIVEYSGEVIILPNKADPIVARFEHVYGHPRLADGRPATTSKIVSISPDGVIETLNTIYRQRGNHANQK